MFKFAPENDFMPTSGDIFFFFFKLSTFLFLNINIFSLSEFFWTKHRVFFLSLKTASRSVCSQEVEQMLNSTFPATFPLPVSMTPLQRSGSTSKTHLTDVNSTARAGASPVAQRVAALTSDALHSGPRRQLSACGCYLPLR